MELLDAQTWDRFVADYPEAHILQTSPWGFLKADFGWKPRFVRQGQLGALVLFRRLPLGLTIAYVPRGPVGNGDWEGFWHQVDDLCRQEHAVFLRVEPDIWEPVQANNLSAQLPGFMETKQTIQPPRTILIDLGASEEELLQSMKSKTRYNIRLAERKGVKVEPSDNVELFHKMMMITGRRDAFGTHSLAYYRRVYDLFAPRNACQLLIASYNRQPIAGLMAFAHGNTAWYFYGASTDEERNRMPTYLLQWEAIRWAKNKGCRTYDLWGIPDYPEDKLEDQFLKRSDGLWGVYRFKRGFGGEVHRTVGAWDRVYRPLVYKLYQVWADRRQSIAA